MLRDKRFIFRLSYYYTVDVFHLGIRIQNAWILQDVHLITTLLHPALKSFQLYPNLHEKAVDLMKSELLKRQSSSTSNNCVVSTQASIHTVTNNFQSSSSITKSILSQCFDAPTTNLTSSPQPFHELEEYLSADFQFDENDDVLSFWIKEKSKFPSLFSIVKDFYTIPASNTSVERLFSASKNTITDKRTSLHVEKVNKLLFLQKNLPTLKKIDTDLRIQNPSIKPKRGIFEEESSSTISPHIEDEFITTSEAKKLKSSQKDNLVLIDDIEEEQENNAFDFN